MAFRFELRYPRFLWVTCQNVSIWAKPTSPSELKTQISFYPAHHSVPWGVVLHVSSSHSFLSTVHSLRKWDQGIDSCRPWKPSLLLFGKGIPRSGLPQSIVCGRGMSSWWAYLLGPKVSSPCGEGHSLGRASAVPLKLEVQVRGFSCVVLRVGHLRNWKEGKI